MFALGAAALPRSIAEQDGDPPGQSAPSPSPEPSAEPSPVPDTTQPPTTEPPSETAPREDAPGAEENPGESAPEVEENLELIDEENRSRLADLQVQADELARQVADVRQTVGELDVGVEDLNDRIAEVLRRLSLGRRVINARAVVAYKGESESYLSVLLDATSASDFLSRVKFLSEANLGDRTSIESLELEKVALVAQQRELADVRQESRAKVAELEAALTQLGAKLDEMLSVLATLPAQQAIAVNGFVFPSVEPFSYTNDWGNCRQGCTRKHKGTDVFCVWGAPLRAAENGKIVNANTTGLGGVSLWVSGESGTEYYYAHMSSFYPGVDNGTEVVAGQFVGFCGNSGNARSTPPHVHFQVHPDGRSAPGINPFPILKATELAMKTAAQVSATGFGSASSLSPSAEVDEAGNPILPSADVSERQPDHPGVAAQNKPTSARAGLPGAVVNVERAPRKRNAF